MAMEYVISIDPKLEEIINKYHDEKKVHSSHWNPTDELLIMIKDYLQKKPMFDRKAVRRSYIDNSIEPERDEYYMQMLLMLNTRMADALKIGSRKSHKDRNRFKALDDVLRQYENYLGTALKNPLRGALDRYFAGFNNSYLVDPEEYTSIIGFENPEKKNYFHRIASFLNEQSLAVCVGAGITQEYVGSWSSLLNSLLGMRCYSTLRGCSSEELQYNGCGFGNMNTSEGDVDEFMAKYRSSFIRESVNYLERGEYLMYDSSDTALPIGTEDENEYRELFFAEQVKRSIAKRTKKEIENHFPDGSAKSVTDCFYKRHCHPNGEDNTLSGVVQLCIRKRVKEIITYNFDTILDRLLADEKIRKYYAPHSSKNYIYEIYSFTSSKPVLVLKPKSFNSKKPAEVYKIYHVHGLLDEECKTEPVVFSENSYQSYQRTSLNWSNIHLADVMSRNNTLYIGFSGDDSNYRMLMHFLDDTDKNPVMRIDKENKKKIYLMKDYSSDLKKLIDNTEVDAHPDCAYACVKTYFDILIMYFRKQLGTSILWSNGFQEMAEQLIYLSETE